MVTCETCRYRADKPNPILKQKLFKCHAAPPDLEGHRPHVKKDDLACRFFSSRGARQKVALKMVRREGRSVA